jgi:hypothetical protein
MVDSMVLVRVRKGSVTAKHPGVRRYLRGVRRRRVIVPTLALLWAGALLVPAGGAAGAAGPWATVNVCDTAGHPDGVGIRAAMPGNGVAGDRMLVRLRVQYRDRGGRWRLAGAQADSGWLDLGSARARMREVGRTFTIRPPAGGGAFVLRGAAVFEWRRGDTVVRRARRLTRGGHHGTAGADPPGYSAATCTIR